MGTEIKIWEVVGETITPAAETSYASTGTEEQLEKWIKECPNILGDELLVIDRQRYIENVGILDLLCLDINGTLVLVELKRGKAPREAVAQALDYASWLSDATSDDIKRNAEQFLKGSLDEKFLEAFGRDLEEELNPENHKILLVAAALDAGAERIISYLARKYAVDINAVFFKYSKLRSGDQILVRTVLVPDEIFKPAQKKLTEQQLLDVSDEKQSRQLVDICRRLVKEEYVWDKPSRTYGGSFRFWGHREKGGKFRMVTGLNVAGVRCLTPKGQLDVWIPVKSLAEVSNADELVIRKFLQSFHQVEIQSAVDVVIRLKSTADAEKFLVQMKKWFTFDPK
jgi:hypothetical protein